MFIQMLDSVPINIMYISSILVTYKSLNLGSCLTFKRSLNEKNFFESKRKSQITRNHDEQWESSNCLLYEIALSLQLSLVDNQIHAYTYDQLTGDKYFIINTHSMNIRRCHRIYDPYRINGD